MKFNTVKSKVLLFLSILTLLGTIFCFVSCDNFLSENLGKTTININLDLSKLIKNSRNDDTQINGYVLKLFVYDAKNYQEGDKEIEKLPLLTQTSNKVDINGTVKANLELSIASTVIFVGKLFTLNENDIESEKPLYAGKTDVYKVLPYNNNVHLVLTKTHEHTFATDWTYDGAYHWKAATCEHVEEVSEKSEHTFDGIACTECDYEIEGFVYVKGGTIEGAANTNNYAGVFVESRTVTLSDFYMGKYEVTQEEYASVMAGQKVTVNGVEYELEYNPSSCTEDSTRYTLFEGEKQGKRPVDGVTWYDAVWYCNALSEKEGLTPAYTIEVITVKQLDGKSGYFIYEATVTLDANATGYRLPTEAEWEYAARAGDDTVDAYTYSGTNDENKLYNYAWYSNNSKSTTYVVATKHANAFGLYDMSGNVR